VAAKAVAPFEVRIASTGNERRYRVEVETFEFGSTGRRPEVGQ